MDGLRKEIRMTCNDCGHRLFLTSLAYYEMEVEPDEEPYEAGVIEPVVVNGKEIETLFVELHAIAHVCPNCEQVRLIEINKK